MNNAIILSPANYLVSRASAGQQFFLENNQTNNQPQNFSNNHDVQSSSHRYNADVGGHVSDENDIDEGNMDVDDDLL